MKEQRTSAVAPRPPAANSAAGVPPLLSLASVGIVIALIALSGAFSATASADTTVCSPGSAAGHCERPQGIAVDFETGHLYVADQKNNRIDVFESNGAFAFAFGWGVANGGAELQSCGPAASPPTAQCRVGLEGEAGGAFEFIQNRGARLAVDNDPTSSSHHDLYLLEMDHAYTGSESYRVQKFDPEGHFLLAFGGGVITGGAQGTGDLSAGSTQVTDVQTTAKTFELGQTIESSGKIPPETKIVAVGPGTINLSKPASTSGAGAPLSVAEGAGNVPVNQVTRLVGDLTANVGPAVRVTTPDPSLSSASTPERGLPPNATAAELQKVIEELPNVGAGNASVTEGEVTATRHEYLIEFGGPRFADTNVEVQAALGSNNVHEIFSEPNGGGSAEICTVAASCSRGIEGNGHGQIARRPQIAVGPDGDVYVLDCVSRSDLGACKDRLQEFESTGGFLEEIALPQSTLSPNGLAVDSSGDFYVSVNDAIRKYDPLGNPVGLLPVAEQVGALAIDSSDNLFASERDTGFGGLPIIAEYGPSGATLRRFGYGILSRNLALISLAPYSNGDGDVFTTEGDGSGVFHRSFPPAGPLLVPNPCQVKAGSLGNHKATLFAAVNPEGKPTTAHFDYITAVKFAEDGNAFGPGTEETAESPSIGEDFHLHEAAIKVEDLQPETEYRCRAIVTDSESRSVTSEAGAFTTLEGFEFGPSWSADVGQTTATIVVRGNPLGIEATGQIEYVEDAKYQLGKFAEPQSAPSSELDFGASEEAEMQTREVTLSSLAPGTLYHYRLHVRNGTPPEGFVCPHHAAECPEFEHTFRTYPVGVPEAPDGRRYELVSPSQKNGAEVGVPDNRAGFEPDHRYTRILAGSSDGEAVTYTSYTSFGEAEAAPGTSQYLSRRTTSGWVTEDISPFGYQWIPIEPQYNGFTPDFHYSVFKLTEPSLTPDCRKREDMYLRDDATGQLHCLDPEVAGGPGACLVYAGASEDGSRVFLAGRPEGAPAYNYSLYEWTPAGGPQLLSVLPNGQPVPATGSTGFGPGGPRHKSEGIENCQFTRTRLRNAVSADGTKAFWTYIPEEDEPKTKLFVRVDGTETRQLDAHQSGSGSASGNGVFWVASADGHLAYFTDTEKLIEKTNPAKGEPDLYSYQLGARKPLTDLTGGTVPGDVQGVIGASDDGSYVYFVAKAALTGGEEDEAGEKALEGAENLYYSHEGTPHFIARLAAPAGGDSGDARDWSDEPRQLTARVSPDGLSLAFFSIESEPLVGYENTIARGEHCRYNPERSGPSGSELYETPRCPEAFLFNAETGRLICASCNPSGSRPLGPAYVPGWSNGFEGPRFLSNDGERLFFESFDRLSDADESPRIGVYEFELAGAGSCTTQSPSFDPASGGCHFLLSAPRRSDDDFLIDASADGRDVFISTRSALTGWDKNKNYDVYDYRAGGGFPEPPLERPPCEGEGCKPPPVPAPGEPTPPHFEGAGNVHQAPRHCPKGTHPVRRGAVTRCAKLHHPPRHHKRMHRKHDSTVKRRGR